jgi:hypothetical protein
VLKEHYLVLNGIAMRQLRGLYANAKRAPTPTAPASKA